MMAVVLPVIPVTIPVDPTLAFPGDAELQVPPPASVNAVVVPGQTVIDPVITAGSGFTVIAAEPTIPLLQPVAGLLADTV